MSSDAYDKKVERDRLISQVSSLKADRDHWQSLWQQSYARCVELEAKCLGWEQRSLTYQMLSFKWMDAHDKRAAGKDYEYPSPADIPNCVAERDALHAALAKMLANIRYLHMRGCAWPGEVCDCGADEARKLLEEKC